MLLAMNDGINSRRLLSPKVMPLRMVFWQQSRKVDHTNIASAVFSPPYCVGMSEEDAVAAGINQNLSGIISSDEKHDLRPAKKTLMN